MLAPCRELKKLLHPILPFGALKMPAVSAVALQAPTCHLDHPVTHESDSAVRFL